MQVGEGDRAAALICIKMSACIKMSSSTILEHEGGCIEDNNAGGGELEFLRVH